MVSLPCQRPPRSVYSLQVCVTQVQLTANQNDRSSWAEVLNFRVPHGLHMVERVGVGDWEAEHHDIRPEEMTQGSFSQLTQHANNSWGTFFSISPAICKTAIFMMVSKCIPKAKGYTYIIHNIPGALQNLTNGSLFVSFRSSSMGSH